MVSYEPGLIALETTVLDGEVIEYEAKWPGQVTPAKFDFIVDEYGAKLEEDPGHRSSQFESPTRSYVWNGNGRPRNIVRYYNGEVSVSVQSDDMEPLKYFFEETRPDLAESQIDVLFSELEQEF